MSLIELEKKHIRPLTRAEKWQLMRDIQDMLQQEEKAAEESVLRKIFKPGTVYEVATPSLSPGSDDAKAAVQLSKLLDEPSA